MAGWLLVVVQTSGPRARVLCPSIPLPHPMTSHTTPHQPQPAVAIGVRRLVRRVPEGERGHPRARGGHGRGGREDREGPDGAFAIRSAGFGWDLVGVLGWIHVGVVCACTVAEPTTNPIRQVVGTTAIEDKLQEGVPDTIADLLDGGIKVFTYVRVRVCLTMDEWGSF